VNVYVEWQFQLGRTAQTLTQDFFLDLELVLVAGVLVVTSAAAGVVLASWLDAVRRRIDDRICFRSSEAGPLLGQERFDFFLGQDKGDKHGLAASVGFIGVRSGGQTGQAVAAVDQLFDCEEQELILRHGRGRRCIADSPERTAAAMRASFLRPRSGQAPRSA
jgi:hypothetical protein